MACDAAIPPDDMPSDAVSADPRVFDGNSPASAGSSVAGTRRDSPELVQVTISMERFEIPVNQSLVPRPALPGGSVDSIGLGLYWIDGQLRGPNNGLPDFHNQISVWITPEGRTTAFGTDPPDSHFQHLIGLGFVGPVWNPALGQTEYRHQSGSSAVYVMLDPADRDPDGTHPAVSCNREHCNVSAVRLDPKLNYHYDFNPKHISEWRNFHRAIRQHIESLRRQ